MSTGVLCQLIGLCYIFGYKCVCVNLCIFHAALLGSVKLHEVQSFIKDVHLVKCSIIIVICFVAI